MIVETKARILIVQDDPVSLGLVCGSLRPDGHDIIETRSPMEALHISAHDFQGIDLVVAEVESRPITGIELANRLLRKGIDVPMLFMSPSRSISAIIAHSLGPSAVIEEPFTGAQLRTHVRRRLADHRRKPQRD